MASRSTVIPISAATTSVSTRTVLMNWRKFDGAEVVLFSVQNYDATNNAYLVLETSQDGTRPDGSPSDTPTALPGGQASIEIGPRQIRRYYRLSAQTDSPSFPVVAVTYEVVARWAST